jgi:hypothetical protein
MIREQDGHPYLKTGHHYNNQASEERTCLVAPFYYSLYIKQSSLVIYFNQSSDNLSCYQMVDHLITGDYFFHLSNVSG